MIGADYETLWIRALAKECADAVRGRNGIGGTIEATIRDGVRRAQRETANSAGALLRDRARDLEAEAERDGREGDTDEAAITHQIAHEVNRLSMAVYALGEPPKTDDPEVADDDIAF